MSEIRATMLAQRFAAAQAIATECGRLALGYFNDRASLGVTMKGYQDFLTVADGAVETHFRKRIAEVFPGDAVMGEEQGGAGSDRLWIIDPIDGTANFARGDRNWCVSIGFLLDGKPEIGVIEAAALQETWTAQAGLGAKLNGTPIRPADTTDIRRATVEIGWSPRRPMEDYLAMVGRVFSAGANVKRSASGALGLTHAANGRTDGYAEIHINSWDVAAGVVIAAEAGCFVSDFFAGSGLTEGNPILVANRGLAEKLKELTGIS